MQPVEIRPGIYWIGVNDHTTDLFEGLWPIQNEGISYNSYLINDDKRAIIDLSKEFLSEEYLAQIKQIIPLESLDYIIVNHVEPDHSGALTAVRQAAPRAEIIGTKNTQKLLAAFYGITEGVRVINERDSLPLGKYMLRFFPIPFVHWPESMMCYEPGEKILFSNDAFGAYGLLPKTIFEDELDGGQLEYEALRYYSNIVAHYYKSAGKALEKLENLPVEIIAPSHGPVWRKNPLRIINWYRKWVSNATAPADSGITLLYGSMYQNTERMMKSIAMGIAAEDVPFKIFDAGRVHPSYILPELLSWQGVMIGGPTYEGELFPPLENILRMAVKKKIFKRKSAYFGSYGWGGGAKETYLHLAEKLEWENAGTLEFNGAPTADDLKQGERFGMEFARAIKGGCI
jgi:anaerobic nitric oxide reductase flavorubredoxin